jgi:hypothetical protein
MFEKFSNEELSRLVKSIKDFEDYYVITNEVRYKELSKIFKNKSYEELQEIYYDMDRESYCRYIADKYKNDSDSHIEMIINGRDRKGQNNLDHIPVQPLRMELYRRSLKRQGVAELPVNRKRYTEKERDETYVKQGEFSFDEPTKER